MKKLVLISISMLFLLISPIKISAHDVSAQDAKPLASPAKPLIIGVFPRRNAKTTYRMFKHLANHLSKAIGRPVELKTAKNFPMFWANIKKGYYDIVHYNQYHYLKSKKLFGYKVILRNTEFGQSTLRSSLVVRKDSNINSLKDLKGKTINFAGGKRAFVAYLLNLSLLNLAGVDTKQYTTRFSKNPVYATFAVYHKNSDAAGVGNIILKLKVIKKRIDVGELKYLAKSEKVPHLPWAVRQNMNPQLTYKIQDVMSKLHSSSQGKVVLKHAQIDRFIKTNDADYDIVRILVKQVLNESL